MSSMSWFHPMGELVVHHDFKLKPESPARPTGLDSTSLRPHKNTRPMKKKNPGAAHNPMSMGRLQPKNFLCSTVP